MRIFHISRFLLVIILFFYSILLSAQPVVDVDRGVNVNRPLLNQDQVITSNVQARLLNEKKLVGKNILVTTKGGVVTLQGTVDTREQASAALKQAQICSGVKNVDSQLVIRSK